MHIDPSLLNPTALKMAKILWSFGHSECDSVKELKKQITKFMSAKFNLCKLYQTENSKTIEQTELCNRVKS